MEEEKKHKAVLVLAWPDVTARSEDKIMKWLRKVGIVKNLNVQVGHAAMMIVDGSQLRYYDFGRYVTPHHKGRVRSAKTDPMLAFYTQVRWTKDKNIANIDEICHELASKARYTHGEGKLWMTIYTTPEIMHVEEKALEMQRKGLIGYNTFDKTQTNCARFVQTCILAGLKKNRYHYIRFNYPVTYYAPTPYFNILAAIIDKNYFIEWKDGEWRKKSVPLLHSYWDITTKVFSSMMRSRTQFFSDDRILGQLTMPHNRPENVHHEAIFLGGIGEAAWYHCYPESENLIRAVRWFIDGEKDFESTYQVHECLRTYIHEKKYRLIHDSHKAWLTLQADDGRVFRLPEKVL